MSPCAGLSVSGSAHFCGHGDWVGGQGSRRCVTTTWTMAAMCWVLPVSREPWEAPSYVIPISPRSVQGGSHCQPRGTCGNWVLVHSQAQRSAGLWQECTWSPLAQTLTLLTTRLLNAQNPAPPAETGGFCTVSSVPGCIHAAGGTLCGSSEKPSSAGR